MPTVTMPDGTALHYEIDGTAGKPWLIFSNSLGTDLHMWDDQVPAFADDYRILRYDSRGHGRSGAPAGGYSIDLLGADAIALMNALDIGTANWCGLSKGGMVGMWLGTNHPDRFTRMVFSNTAAHMPTSEMWADRARTAREQGMGALEDAILERWFTRSFRDTAAERVEKVRAQIRATPGEGYASCCEAIGAMNQRASITMITLPVLVIAGAQDPATPPDKARFIADAIQGAELVVIEDAAHLSNIEQTEAFNREVRRFLAA